MEGLHEKDASLSGKKKRNLSIVFNVRQIFHGGT
jgi:hypothetical protein